jgi:hypothetical protein
MTTTRSTLTLLRFVMILHYVLNGLALGVWWELPPTEKLLLGEVRVRRWMAEVRRWMTEWGTK